MNAHDSERIKGMLEELGLGEAPTADEADVVVFNTCTIREKPDTKLSAYLGDAGARKRETPDLVIAVGGCFAEAQQERIFDLYPQVDVAFGPGSIPHLGEWVGTGGAGVDEQEPVTGDLRKQLAKCAIGDEQLALQRRSVERPDDAEPDGARGVGVDSDDVAQRRVQRVLERRAIDDGGHRVVDRRCVEQPPGIGAVRIG